jgi:hypothetical protein
MRTISFILLLLGTSTMVLGQSIQNATLFPGADIGAQINNAIAYFDPSRSGPGGGVVFIPSSSTCYAMTTPVVISRNSIKIQGAGRNATCIRWSSSTGTAFTVQGGYNSMEDLAVLGPSLSSQTNVGLNVSAADFSLARVNLGGFTPQGGLSGFSVGLTFGANGFTDTFIDLFAWYNNQNMVFPSGLSDAGENIRFIGGTFADGTSTNTANCVQIGTPGQLAGADISFFGTSFDGCQVVNNEGVLRIYGGHFEDVSTLNNIPFVVTQSTLIEGNRSNQGTYISGASVIYDRPNTANGVFEIDGNGNLFVSELTPHGNPPIPLFYFGGTGSPSLTFHDSSSELRGNSLYTIGAGSSPYLNIQTPALSVAHNGFQTVLGSTASVTLGQNNFVLQRDDNLIFYKWTGVSNSYYVTKFQENSGGGLSICTAPNEIFTGDYSVLGFETFTCNTPVTKTINYGSCSIKVNNGMIVDSSGC